MKDAFLRTHRELVNLLASCWAAFPCNRKFENDSKPHFRKSDAGSSSYRSLEQAFQDFQWDKKCFVASTISLLKSQSRIQESIKTGSQGELFADLCGVLRWGGVLTTAIAGPLLDKREHGQLIEYFSWISSVKPFDASAEDLNILQTIPDECGDLLSNSGLTKIYSVLGSSCVIYDDRVSAALGKIITWYLGDRELPDELKLVMSTKRSRNPSTCVQKFPTKIWANTEKKAIQQVVKHAESNVKANWLIGAVVQKLRRENEHYEKVLRYVSTAVQDDIDDREIDDLWLAMRIFESSLFMAGYSVNSVRSCDG